MNVSLQLPEWVDLDRYETHQAPIVEEIVNHFNGGADLCVLDAPTGSGKTTIAEAVRQTLHLQTLYTCNAKVLQDQVKNDFPYAAVIKGRSSYTPIDASPIMGIVPSCADCDNEPSVGCSLCPEALSCPYTLAKQAAVQASLSCANYAYLLGECNNSRTQFSGRDFIVADECDVAEQEVMRYVSVEITPRMQRFLGIASPEKKTKESAWRDWFEYAIPFIEKKLKYLPDRTLPEKRQKATIVRLLTRMAGVANDLERYVYTGYEEAGRIEFKPVVVDHLADDVLWRHGKKWLAMSATVVSPEQFVESLGFKGAWAPVFAPSTFPKENRPIFYCPTAFVSKKTETTAWPKLAQACTFLSALRPTGRILIHSHSYALTRYLHNMLAGKVDRDVFAYFNSNEREGAIARFEETEDAILVAPSLDRGYDGKDELVRCIIIAKLPFAYLGDKQVSTRLYTTKGGEQWYAVGTARSLIQQTGRGVRHDQDFCETFVLDEMFAKFYGQWVDRGNVSRYGDEEVGDGRTIRRHRLFPTHFTEAIQWNSDVRFDLRQLIRDSAKRTREAQTGELVTP